MKKIQLKLGKEMLSKEQMKKVTGGTTYCYYMPGYSSCGNPTDTCPYGQVLFACGWHHCGEPGPWCAGVPDCYSSVFYTCGYPSDCGHRCDIVTNV